MVNFNNFWTFRNSPEEYSSKRRFLLLHRGQTVSIRLQTECWNLRRYSREAKRSICEIPQNSVEQLNMDLFTLHSADFDWLLTSQSASILSSLVGGNVLASVERSRTRLIVWDGSQTILHRYRHVLNVQSVSSTNLSVYGSAIWYSRTGNFDWQVLSCCATSDQFQYSFSDHKGNRNQVSVEAFVCQAYFLANIQIHSKKAGVGAV